MWAFRGLPLGRLVWTSLSVAAQGVHLCKEALVFRGVLIFVMPKSGLPVDLDHLEDEGTPLESSLFCLDTFFLVHRLPHFKFYERRADPQNAHTHMQTRVHNSSALTVTRKRIVPWS